MQVFPPGKHPSPLTYSHTRKQHILTQTPGEPTICALNSTWREAFGSVGGSQIGLLTRLHLVFLLDPSTQPTRQAMERWVDFMLKWNHGLRFITQLEMYLFLAAAIGGDWRLWPWASFVMLGGKMPARRRRDMKAG